MHVCDINAKPYHLPKRLWAAEDDVSTNNSDASFESDSPSGTKTPASSVDSEIASIDPHPLEPHCHYHETSLPVKEIAISMNPQLGLLLLLLFLEATSIQCWPWKP